MANKTSFFVGGLTGAIVATLAFKLLVTDHGHDSAIQQVEEKPLYWVAPMDPNFRRDGPGLSPMGMDLIPVYADDIAPSEPGTVRITPNVEHNMGVRLAQVQRRELPTLIDTVGYIQYNAQHLIHVHPRVSGWVEELYVIATGERVVKGQPLYALYAPELVSAQEDYLLARDGGREILINAAANRLAALGMPQEAIAKLGQTGTAQQTVIMPAPASGVVDNLAIREGFFIEPGTNIMSIGSVDDVWVEAEILARHLSLLRTGQAARMTLDFVPGREWLGQLDYIYPTLDATTRTARVRLRFANPEGLLKPNMFAQVRVETGGPGAVLTVPKAAVIRTGKQDRVVLQKAPGEFKSVAVELGLVGDEYIQILSGLEEGDVVVRSGQFLLDSESSISSDFLRMSPLPDAADSEDEVQSACVAGVVNAIDRDSRVLNISRDAIAKWNRGPATMDFTAAENLPLHSLLEGSEIEFEFEIRDGDFVVTAIAGQLCAGSAGGDSL